MNRISNIIRSDKFLEKIDIIGKELGIMYCYCSNNVKDRIFTVLYDIHIRQFLLENKEKVINAGENKEFINIF